MQEINIQTERMGDMEKNEQKWDKQEYLYRMFSHHTKDKEMENYVVNAIWARLDDLNVKPVTQQYVRRPNGYALIDLYFPQINYGVECDEAYHKDNTLKDAAREIDLQTALSACSEDGLTICRVDATLDADALHARIREIVCEIKQKVAERGNQLPHWLNPEEEWRGIKERGILRVEDVYSFNTIADICQKCFGKDKNYKIQRSFFRVTDDRMLWCPKLAIKLPNGSKAAQTRGWVNELSADGKTIIEYNDSGTSEVKHPNKPRLTFAKSKDERGEDAYRFVGVFQYTKNTAEGHHVYSRVCDKFDLSI